jgi:Fic family protein
MRSIFKVLQETLNMALPDPAIIKVLMKREHLAAPVRGRLQRYPEPYDNHYGVVPLPPAEESVNLGFASQAHRAALEAIGRADALARSFPKHFLLSRILVRQEALKSSAIEGTHSTLDQLLTVEASNDLIEEGQVSSSDLQVKSYALALERALSDVQRNKYDAFSIGLIRDLQREVVKDDPKYRYFPGEIRTHVVHIGGGFHISQSDYNPAPPDTISACLVEHIDYLRCEGLQSVTQSIIARMALAHAHFEAIHPFPDGNGRVGRLLLPLMLAADGHTPLYLAPYIARNKPSYIDGLKAAQQRLDYGPLIAVLSNAILATVDLSENAHTDLIRLSADWKSRGTWRKNSAAKRALEVLPGFPVITASRLAGILKVSAPSVSAALRQLIEAKILTEKTGFKRNRIFVAQEVLEIYNRSP